MRWRKPRSPSRRHSCSVRKVTCAEDKSLSVVISASASASAPRTASSNGRGPDQQAWAGDGCERYRDLKLGVIVAACALERLGPAMVEDIFAARVGLHITGRGAEQGARSVLGEQVAGLPAGAGADRVRSLDRRQKSMRNKRVIYISSCG